MYIVLKNKATTMFFLKKMFLVDFMLSCIFGYNILSVMFLFVILEDKLFILMLALLKILSVKRFVIRVALSC